MCVLATNVHISVFCEHLNVAKCYCC